MIFLDFKFLAKKGNALDFFFKPYKEYALILI